MWCQAVWGERANGKTRNLKDEIRRKPEVRNPSEVRPPISELLQQQREAKSSTGDSAF
jgi:hypothetical protein